MTVSNTELSVVVLSYRSEKYTDIFCRQLVKELTELAITYEIILVANYDSDQDLTPEIAQNLHNEFENVRYLAFQKKGKMGWDMRMGLDASKGKYIAVIDGDGQMPVSDIPVVYNIIKHNKGSKTQLLGA